ncbi:MAG: alpha/beta fold hydrolase [Patescibacteria group bacterium]
MKRVFIVHGWAGTPQEGWFPWLRTELENRGFQVFVPQLPDANVPSPHTWVPALAAAVGVADRDTYFVGHSMGCQTIARYLEGLDDSVTVGGVVYVAGFFSSLALDTDEDEKVWNEWKIPPLDFARVRACSPKSVALFSDDDPWVPLRNQDDFRDKLGSEIIVEHGMNHFNESSGCLELPIVLESVLTLAA